MAAMTIPFPNAMMDPQNPHLLQDWSWFYSGRQESHLGFTDVRVGNRNLLRGSAVAANPPLFWRRLPIDTRSLGPPRNAHQIMLGAPLLPPAAPGTQQNAHQWFRSFHDTGLGANGWFDRLKYLPVKYLGGGGQGRVSVFEKTDNKGPLKRICVKESLLNPLNREIAMMHRIRRPQPHEHIVNIIHNARYPDRPSTAPQAVAVSSILPPDVVPQMWFAMDYCEDGDLHINLQERKVINNWFTELELWSIFSCLAKAISVLSCGSEDPTAPLWPAADQPVIHFDIKPMNIFLGKNISRGDHQTTNIHKLGDFGLARAVDPTWTARDRQRLRRLGTYGFYVPEQFTARWDCNNPMTSGGPAGGPAFGGVAGNYNTHSNIYALGALMWQCMYLWGVPSPKAWKDPPPPLAGGGPVIGYGTPSYPPAGMPAYSATLENLIHKCMREEPRHRPTMVALHQEIATARAAAGMMVKGCGENRPEVRRLRRSTAKRKYYDNLSGPLDEVHAVRRHYLNNPRRRRESDPHSAEADKDYDPVARPRKRRKQQY